MQYKKYNITRKILGIDIWDFSTMLKHLSVRSDSRGSWMSDDFILNLPSMTTSADNEKAFEKSMGKYYDSWCKIVFN